MRRVREHMTAEVFTLRADKDALLAEQIMDWAHVRHVPIVDERGGLLGILNHRDLVEVDDDSGLRAPVHRAMARGVRSIGPDDDVREAARIMKEHEIGALPVVENGLLVGILSATDLVHLVAALPDRMIDGLKPPTVAQGTLPSGYTRWFREGQEDRRVADLMSEDPVTVSATDTVAFARDMMLRLGFHCLPVADDEGAPIGIVTSHDLLGGEPAAALSSVMSINLTTIPKFDPVSAAAELMMERGIHHLVVVQGGVTAGVLSSFDLLAAVGAAGPE